MIQKKMLASFFPLTFIIVFTFYFLSCNILSEPEPLVNNSVHPPKVNYKTAVLRNFTMDQVVTGIINVAFNLDFDTNDVISVTVYIDSTNICSKTFDNNHNFINSPIEINTVGWPDGKHIISFRTKKQTRISDSLGISSLKYNNTIYIYRTSLIFDNSPLAAPINVKAELENNNAHISWTSTSLNNFQYYIICRDGKEIAKIYTQSTSSYIDTTLPDFYKGYYEVGAFNGLDTAYSQKYSLSKGEFLEISFKEVIDNLDNKVLFIKSDNSLISVSTQTHEIIKQSNSAFDGIWVKNTTNDTLYCWDYSNNFYTIDAENFNVIKKQSVSYNNYSASTRYAAKIAVGPGNKVYFSIYVINVPNSLDGVYLYAFDKDTKVFDYNSCKPIVKLDRNPFYIKISPDGEYLVVIDDLGIKKYSLKSGTKLYSQEYTIIDYSSSRCSINWDNSSIFIAKTDGMYSYVTVWDLHTLNYIQTYYWGIYKSIINAVYTSSKKLYVALTINKLNLLQEYDISTGQLIRSWTFPSGIQYLYGSDKGRYLFACTKNEQWIIDLGGTK